MVDKQELVERIEKQIIKGLQEYRPEGKPVSEIAEAIASAWLEDREIVKTQTALNIWTNFDIEVKKRDLSSDKMPGGFRKMTDKEILGLVINRYNPALTNKPKGETDV